MILQRKKKSPKESIKTIGSLSLNLAAIATSTSPIELHLQIEPVPGIEIKLQVIPPNFGNFDQFSAESIAPDSKEVSDECPEIDYIEVIKDKDHEIASLVKRPF